MTAGDRSPSPAGSPPRAGLTVFVLVLALGACSTPKKKTAPPRYLTPQARLEAARKTLSRSRHQKTARSRRADLELTAARLYRDAGRTPLALPILSKVVADPKAPARTRARAAWLLLQYTDCRESGRYWELLEKYPDTVAAEDALWRYLELATEPPGDRIRRLVRFYGRHRTRTVADLVLFEAARQAHRQPGEAWRNYAVHLLDFLAKRHPDSPRRDEALITAARWSRELGRTKEAIGFVRRLLETRETSLFFGDYNSQYLDDAQLLLGDLHLERGETKAALSAWRALPQRFPKSRLRDRVQLRLMDTYTTLGQPKQACAAARELVKKTPRSRFAPRAKNLLAGCPKRP